MCIGCPNRTKKSDEEQASADRLAVIRSKAEAILVLQIFLPMIVDAYCVEPLFLRLGYGEVECIEADRIVRRKRRGKESSPLSDLWKNIHIEIYSAKLHIFNNTGKKFEEIFPQFIYFFDKRNNFCPIYDNYQSFMGVKTVLQR